MNQEDKNLLLRDLCARFPYGVKVRVHDIKYGDFDSYLDSISINCVETHPIKELTMDFNPYVFYKLQEIKPYLRPMSSMTEEECIELGNIKATIENISEVIPNVPYYIEVAYSKQIDWLNAHHFDYQGLIEKDLALKASDGMYDIK